MTDSDLESDSRVIRLFPGYAGTALWAWSGTVDYEDSRLSSEVIAALRAWESLGEQAGLTDVPLSKAVEAAWLLEGERLARAVAGELGSGFTVEMTSSSVPFLSNSQQAPTNMAAAEVFETLRTAAVAQHVRSEARLGVLSSEERRAGRYVPLRTIETPDP